MPYHGHNTEKSLLHAKTVLALRRKLALNRKYITGLRALLAKAKYQIVK